MSREKKRFFTFLGGILLLALAGMASLASNSEAAIEEPAKKDSVVKRKEIEVEKGEVFDSIRGRRIPYALFRPKLKSKDTDSIRLVIFSHGYGANYPRNYLNYSYLTKRLAREGFWTLSIQHELEGDSLIPQSGIMQVVRMPFWIRGEANILFVLNHFKEQNPQLRIMSVDLIGHSNGGDMSVLTAKEHPDLIRKVITLDHLRMPLPVCSNPQFASLRSMDKTADAGVLPPVELCDSFGIRVIQLKNITHNQMNDEGTRKQKKQINNYIQKILEDRL